MLDMSCDMTVALIGASFNLGKRSNALTKASVLNLRLDKIVYTSSHDTP